MKDITLSSGGACYGRRDGKWYAWGAGHDAVPATSEEDARRKADMIDREAYAADLGLMRTTHYGDFGPDGNS